MTASKISYFKFTLVLSLIIIAIVGCRRPPDYPDKPLIQFESVEFSGPFTLTLTFTYQDGDADLGLNRNGSDALEPYNDSYIIVGPETDPCNIRDTISSDDERLSDDVTVKTIPNLTGNNIIINLFAKEDGEFFRKPWDIWPTPFQARPDPDCNLDDTFYFPLQRFPRVSETVSDEPIDGTIVISPLDISGFSFDNIIQAGDTFLLEFYIQDRALNKSNVVRTTELVYP